MVLVVFGNHIIAPTFNSERRTSECFVFLSFRSVFCVDSASGVDMP